MTDKENIIRALDCRANDNDDVECTVCPYFSRELGVHHAYCDWRRMLNDAIALLKEQEAVEPIPPTDESDLWRCGNCNHQLFRCTHQRYCEMCGREVKWDDNK